VTRRRIGIVGLGMALKPHALSLRDLGTRVDVAAAFAPSAARRDEAARAWGWPVVDSVDRILGDRSIDMVLVLTPPWTHTDLVGRAAAAGKHVLLEKPVDANAERSAAIVQACDRVGVRLAIVFQHRFRPAALELAKLVRDGRLGKLLSASASIRWWRSPEYFAQPGRGTFARDGGGVLLTQAIHTLDLLLHLAGPAAEVMAYVDTSPLRRIDTEDIVAGCVRYANGASGVIDATTVTFPGYPERIEIAGAQGSAVLEVETLTVNYMSGERFRLDGAAAGGGGADPMAFSHEHHRRVLAEFLDAVDQGREPMNSGRSALHVQRLIDALLASAKAGAPVRLPHG
jgi:predicted dehydrogenase